MLTFYNYADIVWKNKVKIDQEKPLLDYIPGSAQPNHLALHVI